MNLTSTVRIAICGLGLGLGACATEVEGDAEDVETQTGYGVEQSTGMNRFADFSPIANTVAAIERYRSFHEIALWTRELTPGNVVVLEYIVYNAPENCTNPTPWGRCSVPDSMNPATESSAIWVRGRVVRSSGTLAVYDWIGVGEDGAPGEIAWGPGLTDVQGAEVHFLVFDKGKPIAGRLEEQLTTFQGGCDVNVCQPLQFGILPGL